MKKSVIVDFVFISVMLLTFIIQPATASWNKDVSSGSASSNDAFGLTGSTQAEGTDWWPMFHHDTSHTGASTSRRPTTNHTLWQYPMTYGVFSSPAVLDGLVYVGDWDSSFYCLNAATGALVWRSTTGEAVFSSPTVVSNRVYVGCDDHKVYCLNAATGAFVWSYTTDYWVNSSPAVVGGFVYIGSCGHNFYCLNAATGALVWKYTISGNVDYSSPAVVDGFVYFGSSGGSDYHKVYCLNAATGAFVWSYTTGGNVQSSPAVVGGRVYVGSEDYKVYCLNAATGAFVWSYTTGGVVFSSPAVVDGFVYVGDDGGTFYCLNAATGMLVWSYGTGFYIDSSPAVVNGVAYVGSGGGIYAFGLTLWDPNLDSYADVNYRSVWAGGNCYGLSSTEILYYRHYILGDTAYPYFPAQNPSQTRTSELVLPENNNTLNNASLAVMIHQVYDPNNNYIYPYFEFVEYYKLVQTLESGIPALLLMHGRDPANGEVVIHAIVAYAIEPLPDETVNIMVSDPNFPRQENIAHYNLVSHDFTYNAYYIFDRFMVATPQMIQNSWAPAPWWYLKTYWWWNNWLSFSVTGYNIVMADKMVTVKAQIGGSWHSDYFTEWGNSQTFVKGIPESSGIEEGNVQVYAIPNSTHFSVVDPGSSQSTLMITSVENKSGKLFGHGYFINATTAQGNLNYTITPSSSGLSIIAGDNALNASVSFFAASEHGHCVSQPVNVSLSAVQTFNFTAFYIEDSAPRKTVVGQGQSNDIEVTVANKGNSTETFDLSVYGNQTLIGSFLNLSLAGNSTTTKTVPWNTTGFAKGNYTINVYVQPVLGETNTADNTYSCGNVMVTIQGDVNGDRVVDVVDRSVISAHWYPGPPIGPSGYDPNPDINSDEAVDIVDRSICNAHWGQTW